MIVRTTVSRMQFLDGCVRNYPPLWDELHVDRRDNGKTHKSLRFDTRACFVAWEMAIGLMETQVFTERGTSRRDGLTERGALSDVSRYYNAYSRHPAFRRLGVIGPQLTIFPAWDVPGEVYYSPKPVEGGEFVVLVPTWHGKDLSPFTTWEPGSLHGEDRLAHDETHRRLLQALGADVLSGDPEVGRTLPE